MSAPGPLRVLRLPHVARVLSTSLIARLPSAMASLSLILLLAPRHGYALAGVGATLLVGASALTNPLLARWSGRYGVRLVVGCSATVYAAALAVVAVVPSRILGLEYAGAVLAGLALPPVTAVARGGWQRLIGPDALPAVYGLEATAQELVYITGPAVVAVIAAFAGARTALLITAGIGLAGSLAFISAPAFAGPPAVTARVHSTLWRDRHLLALLVLGAGLTGAFGITEVAVVAFASPHHRAAGSLASGLVLAVWSAGSMVGGVVFGHRGRPPTDRSVLFGAFAVAVLIAVPAVSPGRVVLGALLFVDGCAIAPTLARLYTRVAAAVPGGRQTEAFGWLGLAFIVGNSVGNALGGTGAAELGARPALAIAAVPLLLACLAALLLRRATGGTAGQVAEPARVASLR